MQTAERERLMQVKADESAYAIATVVKSGVCVALLALLTVIGFGASVNDTATAATTAVQQKMAAHDCVRAAAHRKQVFDERRARFVGDPLGQFALTPDRVESMASNAR